MVEDQSVKCHLFFSCSCSFFQLLLLLLFILLFLLPILSFLLLFFFVLVPPPFVGCGPENEMRRVVLTIACCICAFRPGTSDFSKATLSYTIFFFFFCNDILVLNSSKLIWAANRTHDSSSKFSLTDCCYRLPHSHPPVVCDDLLEESLFFPFGH